MKGFFAIWLAVMILIGSVVLPMGATIAVLVLTNASAGLSIAMLIMVGFPLTIASGVTSFKLADRVMDWADNHAS